MSSPPTPNQDDLAKRSEARRRKRMVGHRAANHREAELWDLEFWQSRTPQERLSALIAIHRDVELVQAAHHPEALADPE